jgi:hypothetical protein
MLVMSVRDLVRLLKLSRVLPLLSHDFMVSAVK